MNYLLAVIFFWFMNVNNPAVSQILDDDPAMFAWYKVNVHPRILKNKQESSYKPDKETRTVIFVIINKSGQIVSSFIEEPSNVKLADQAALEIAPVGLQFPAIPENIYKKPLGVRIPVVFKRIALNKPFESGTVARKIPTDLNGSTCEIGSDCRFKDKIYVCNYEKAISIINSPNRIEKAEDLVRSKDCEIQLANTRFKTQITPSPDIVYLLKDEIHVGYSPINLFTPVEQNDLLNELRNKNNAVSNISPADDELRNRVAKDIKNNWNVLPENIAKMQVVVRVGILDLDGIDVATLGKCYAYGGELVRSWETSRRNNYVIYKYNTVNSETLTVYVNVLSDQALLEAININGDTLTEWKDLLVFTAGTCGNSAKRLNYLNSRLRSE